MAAIMLPLICSTVLEGIHRRMLLMLLITMTTKPVLIASCSQTCHPYLCQKEEVLFGVLVKNLLPILQQVLVLLLFLYLLHLVAPVLDLSSHSPTTPAPAMDLLDLAGASLYHPLLARPIKDCLNIRMQKNQMSLSYLEQKT